MKSNWEIVAKDLFFSKNDSQDIRLGDLARSCQIENLPENSRFALWGYPDDEGIRINGGRVGAALAPNEIRKFFYKMTPNPWLQSTLEILDLGNLQGDSLSLADRHAQGKQMSYSISKSKTAWISLGGGHDYGYADGAGFLRSHIEEGHRPIVINIDAHLDVRPIDKGFHSGTPFRRLLEEHKGEFDFLEVGIQAQCNSAHHLAWAESYGAKILPLHDIRQSSLLESLKTAAPFLSQQNRRPLWLSFDIDGMSSNEAPGCSQSWTSGLQIQEVSEMFEFLYTHSRFQALSIYEVSPPLDSDSRTSKLAALLAHQFYSLVSDEIKRS